MAITASGAFEGSWYQDTASTTTLGPCATLIDWSQVFACGMFESPDDYNNFVNDLHLEEYSKDLFRVASITPITHEYRQRVRNYCMPAKRNFSGKQFSRL